MTALSDGKGGNVLVLDGEWEADNAWVGAQIPLRETDTAGRDISSYRALNLAWRWEGEIPSDVELSIEIGTLGEDLDGDGTLDAESSPYGGGFTFDDSARGMTLTYGGGAPGKGNGFLDSEDTNGNEFLDDENDGLKVQFNIDTAGIYQDSYPTNQWNYIRLPLSPEKRAKLTSVNALRITAVNAGAGSRTGKLFVGDIFFEGSPWDQPIRRRHWKYRRSMKASSP